MKKILFIAFCLISFLIISCTQSSVKKGKKEKLNEWVNPSDKLKILSTTAMIDDLVKEIGAEDVLHMALIQGELDPHSYELVKGDSEKITCADLIFCNGLELEHGASLKYQLENLLKVCSLGDEIIKNYPEKLIFLEGQVDPHIWMDLSLFSNLVSPIVEKLSIADPKHKEDFKKRGDILIKKMLELDLKIFEKMKNIPSEKRYLITSHDAFFYFTKRYLANEEEIVNQTWKNRFIAPEGLAPDGQISIKDIQRIIDHAFIFNIRVVFPESNVNQDAVKKVVAVLNRKGVKAMLAKNPLYGDAMGEKGSGAEGYLNMMEYNSLVIESYLYGDKDGF